MIAGFNPAGMWQPFGVFSMGVVQGDGRVVHLKGQVALDKDGQVVGKGDMRAQTRKTLENIRAVLASVGGEMPDIVSLTHYVTDIDEFMKTGDIRREFFSEPFSSYNDGSDSPAIPSGPSGGDQRHSRNSARSVHAAFTRLA
jgi:2-iminobutanoate/2-iminopropanoate deaminase